MAPAVPVNAPATVLPIAANHAGDTRALLADLRVSAFGISSPRLHAALIEDALEGRILCRVATQSNRIVGVVLAGPASYWRSVLVTHWRLAIECAGSRLAAMLSRGGARSRDRDHVDDASIRDPWIDDGPPSRTWADPSDAHRIIFVGTAVEARRQGIAAQLYRALMIDHSLVARIASDNVRSLALHYSLGWRLYRDGGGVLAVYERARQTSQSPHRRAAV
jgi:hypothetical protein